MQPLKLAKELPIPAYLQDVYWWAYVHPKAVRFFERQWLVNLILWGHFTRLRDAALSALSSTSSLQGLTLQIACVYGNFTPHLVAKLAPQARLDVVDVLPVQLHNLSQKLPADAPVKLLHSDASQLPLPDHSYQQAVLFFLLHEQPETVRRHTLSEALRVLQPGGRLVIVDYHKPAAWHPLRWLMWPVLHFLEPFALDLWRQDIQHWLPEHARVLHQRTWCGGLYQCLSIEKTTEPVKPPSQS